MASTGEETRWLDQDQQQAWRAYMVGTTLLMDRLDAELRAEFKFGLNEYEVLVRLSESEGHRMRMSSLADALSFSRSRITHTVKRMESMGLVERTRSGNDGRGITCELTPVGHQKLVAAAPVHVNGVRRHLVDLADSDDFAALGRVFNSVADALVPDNPLADIR